MFTINEELVELLRSFGYDKVGKIRRDGQGLLYKTCVRNIGNDLVSVYQERIVEINCRQTVSGSLRGLRAIREHTKDEALLQAVEECLEFGGNHMRTCPFVVSDTRLITETEFKQLSRELTGVSKVFFHLCYYGNCKPEDLRDDSHELSKLSEGIIAVVADDKDSRRNRVIRSSDRWGLSVEECRETLSVFEGFTYIDSGDKSRSFNDYFYSVRGDKWGDYQYYHLYTSHAFKLFNDGLSLEEIAFLQGCMESSLQQRLDKYAYANEGHPLVQKYLAYRAENRRKTK